MPGGSRKSPRRKANQERSRKTVEAILEGAAQVLLRDGYAHATTNRIAERAGVSVGSVYQYFDDKTHVFEALIRSQTSRLVDAITGYRVDASRPLEAALAEILMLSLRGSPFGPEIFQRLDQVPDAALRKAVADARRQVVGFVRSVLEAYRDRLRVTDLDLAAFLVVNAAEGVGMNAEPAMLDQRLVDELTRMFTRYLLEPA